MRSGVPRGAFLLLLSLAAVKAADCTTFPIVDTGQTACFGIAQEIAPPAAGEPYHGQDAQVSGHAPSYVISNDGLTVLDEVTGITWQRMPDTNLDGQLDVTDKLSFWDAQEHPATLNQTGYGGYTDWRLPDIKTLYSLILFTGVDPSGYEGDVSGLIPFIDTDAFHFIYGDESAGERIIDSQYWSSTEYVSETMNGDHTVFGVNFADGRIKGYGTSLMGEDKLSFILCCRGAESYGLNDFIENGDGTITDTATGLVWQQEDSIEGMTWEEALAYAEDLTLAGHDDWRLPNAKELQSIVDYTRSPNTSSSPALSPLFNSTSITNEGGTEDWPSYWSSTTHENWTEVPGAAGCYLCFGRGLGWMQAPFPPFDYNLLDVHGAGCQRSDPKAGDPADYPYGHGPQGDVIRIYNHVRCVRDIEAELGAVNDLQLVHLGNGSLQLNWSAVSGAASYAVYQLDSPYSQGSGTLVSELAGTTMLLSLSGDSGFYRVVARDF
jgi:hypothetical protein